MLDTLLANEINGHIDAAGVQEEVDTFMFEGHDTSAAGITFILLLLGSAPDVQERVYQEIREAVIKNENKPLSITQFGELNFLDRVIKECLRIYPPVAFISRELTEDVYLENNTCVPSGMMMHFHIFDLHRDEEQFPDPERFDPDRFLPGNVEKRHPYSYLPFSAGNEIPCRTSNKANILTLSLTFSQDFVTASAKSLRSWKLRRWCSSC